VVPEAVDQSLSPSQPDVTDRQQQWWDSGRHPSDARRIVGGSLDLPVAILPPVGNAAVSSANTGISDRILATAVSEAATPASTE
jgi:hypothetical protein